MEPYDELDMTGRVVVVTGGAQGMGAASCRLLAARGAQVIVLDKQGHLAEDLVAEIRETGGSADAVAADVCEPQELREAFEQVVARHGRLDGLDNNAAALELTAVDPDVVSIDIEVWEGTMRANLRGPLLGCKYAIPHMVASGGGSIVNMGSISGTRGEGNMIAYGVSKAGVLHLTRAVAAQWGKAGIRCNAVAPGLVLTPNTLAGLPADRRELYVRHSMTPHVGTPEDVAGVVAFLLSPAARYLNGQTVTVDGGLSAALPILADTRDLNNDGA